jgi:hypothetical protein
MVTINDIYQFCLIVANKEQRGSFPPEKFNNLAKIAQVEVISELIGNNQLLGPTGVPPYGYRANRKVDESLRPLLVSPQTIAIRPSGEFDYPYGFIWPDSWSKTDFNPITELQEDEYPFRKQSHVVPPTSDYPVIIFRNPYGFIDPYSIGSFKMSYLQRPPDPVWAFDVVNDEPVYNHGSSVQFTLSEDFALVRIASKILTYLGVNLSSEEILSLGLLKDKAGT